VTADGLLSWLKTTIEGDLAKARAVLQPDDQWYATNDLFREAPCLDWDEAELLTLYSPGAVIARCESELAIIAECQEVPGRGTLAERVIERLAHGYQHRPGFNPDWVSD
jgi:hypothetical protein